MLRINPMPICDPTYLDIQITKPLRGSTVHLDIHIYIGRGFRWKKTGHEKKNPKYCKLNYFPDYKKALV